MCIAQKSLPDLATIGYPWPVAMRFKKYILSLLALYAALLLLSSAAFTQEKPKPRGKSDPKQKTAEQYQNRQRALSLILLDSKIKTLDDAPMRCFARHEVVRFLVDSGPNDLHPYAIDFAKACIEETSKNADEFIYASGTWQRTRMINLIRKIDREQADEIEEQMPLEGRLNSMARSAELRESDDPTRVTAKVLNDIRSGTISPGLRMFVRTLSERDQELANAVLEAVLRHYEQRIATIEPDSELVSFTFEFLIGDVPQTLKNRFLMFALSLGRRAIADRSNETFTRRVTQILSISLHKFKEHLPAYFDEANSILQTLQAAQSEIDKKMKEAFERIEAAEDKLAAMISEARSATDETLKRRLWMFVATTALNENKFKLAVDAAFEVTEPSTVRAWHPVLLKHQIVGRAVKAGDLEAIDYVVDHLDKPGEKAEVLLSAAGHLSKKDSEKEALIFFKRGLDLFQRAEASTALLRQYAKAVELSQELDHGNVFEISRKMTETVNRLPSPDAKDIKDSEGRSVYVGDVLAPATYPLVEVFDKLAEEDPDLAYTISQGIQRRDLRLIAEISVEKFKKYPLPKEEEN